MSQTIKKALYQLCDTYVQERLNALESRLKDIEESMGVETKSSVGDKYETGRAMLHLEKEKQMRQLATVLENKKYLSAIDPDKKHTQVELGAVVETNQGNFYIAISAGKLVFADTTYFGITLASPIGKVLFQQKADSVVMFRGKSYVIEQVY